MKETNSNFIQIFGLQWVFASAKVQNGEMQKAIFRPFKFVVKRSTDFCMYVRSLEHCVV